MSNWMNTVMAIVLASAMPIRATSMVRLEDLVKGPAGHQFILTSGKPAPPGLILTRRWQGEVCRFSVVNGTSEPVSLQEIVLADVPNLLPADAGFYGEGFTMFCSTGGTVGAMVDLDGMTDAGHYKLPVPQGFRTVYNYLRVGPVAGEVTLFAFTSCRRFNGKFNINAERLQIVMVTEGLSLGAGQKWDLEELLISSGPDGPSLMERLANRIAVHHPRLAWPKIPNGWCSWYCYGANIGSEKIRQNLAAFKENLPQVRYIQIDDGYQPRMGDWLESTEKFSGGVQQVVGEIKAAGFEPAIWVAPFIASPDSRLFKEHPDWFVRGEDARLCLKTGASARERASSGLARTAKQAMPSTSSMQPDAVQTGRKPLEARSGFQTEPGPLNSGTKTFGGWRQGPWYMLDGTHAEAQAYLEKVFRTMRSWGCTYFKLDANVWGSMPFGSRNDPNASSVEAYRRGMAAVRRGAGPDAYLLGCNHAYWPSLGEIHGSRTSMDIGRDWKAYVRVARENLLRNWMNDRLWWNDPDCLLVPALAETPEGLTLTATGQKATLDQFLFHAAATYASGGMVLSGDSVVDYTPAQWGLLRKAIARPAIAARFQNDGLEAGFVDEPGRRTAVLLNWTNNPSDRTVRLGNLAGSPCRVTDYWTGKELGEYSTDFWVTLAATSGRVLVLEPKGTATGARQGVPLTSPRSDNVVWASPGRSAADSMPLGNGELGINLWVEENGDLLFYLSRNDSLSEVSQLCKVGEVRVSLSPNPFATGSPFRQELALADGVCEITAGTARIKVFVDAALPAVHVLGRFGRPTAVTAKIETWRSAPQPVPDDSAWTLAGGPHKLMQAADVFPKAGADSVCWYHRNKRSLAFEETVRVQSLEPIRQTLKDPLIHRTFGGWVTGAGLQSVDDRTLATPQPVEDIHLLVASPCEQTATPQDWLRSAAAIAAKAADADAALARTAASWHAFWDRSWVRCDVPPALDGVDPNKVSAEARSMTLGKAYTLQRYMLACAGRSIFPIKFNGSLFTVDPKAMGLDHNPDWRRWGDCHWWQNVRMPYHAMQAAGDFDLMMPLFDTFERIRPFAEARARLYHNVEGCYFAETMTVWGTYANRDYGWDRTGKQPKDVDCMYWRFAWNQGLELVGLMLDYYDYAGDRAFVETRLIPMATSVLKYFDTRFRKDGEGRIVLDPTQAVETYWYDVINDTPSVAGLNDVTARLCALPQGAGTAEQRQFFGHMKAAAPVIPIEVARQAGKDVRRIAVAQKYNPKRSNVENPELFPIWPFRLFGLDRPMLEEARNAYALRGSHNDVGWGYDGNAAALLGMTDEAGRIIKVKVANSNPAYRWPATWGPNFDWLPDQCHGGNLMAMIHAMLLQHAGDKILLLPAWPKDWDVSFKLHAPRQTTVEATVAGGRITDLKVAPDSRLQDVVVNPELR